MRILRTAALTLAIGASLPGFSRPGWSQGLDPALAESCQDAVDGGALPAEGLPVCTGTVVTVHLLQPELGLTLAGGNPVLGTASPLGTKFRSIPRINIGGRISFNWLEIPDVLDFPAGPGDPVGSISALVYMPQLDASVGVFDGLDLSTTLGGFAAIELMGSLGALVLPAGDGFVNDATGLGLGARVGVLRESFTAPGISISAFYKWFNRVQLGRVSRGDDAEIGMDMSLWSLRVGVSKSFVAIGLALVLGWDRYASQVDYGVAGPTGTFIPIVSRDSPSDHSSDRWSAFLDVSYIVLFFNIVAEFGWQGQQRLNVPQGTEASSGGFFGALGIRFTL